ncbi:hypothetical protein CB0940_06354 [Cercospora beticola]|uniref:F-box domain-containing protein n=1 Tax=Cercospora beticola TaxID=122368 RepID=A0A2G5I0W9_CERBT|nr:hypothetical protein CB0940_06354 [Cercospora beticola]PIA98152.1 hypothetical protein CB0940_06354 [Cercospora beticola]WPA98982.1 hypothetical protein RHO25_003595 [Cercospora beticola]CAK1360283.1 unnamed protein product [Cercospora beticola]
MVQNEDGNLAKAGDQQQPLRPNTPMQIEHFPLLELPDELVLRVLYFAVVTSCKDNPIPICEYHDEASRDWVTPATTPAITKTCHLLRKEGLKMYYKHNVFYMEGCFDGMFDFHEWVMTIRPASRAPVGQIWVRWIQGYKPEWRVWAKWVKELNSHSRFKEIVRPGAPCIPREKILVLFRKGKLVMGSGRMDGCYQLNVGEAEGSLSDGWVSSAQMLEKCRKEPLWQPSDGGEDFWVCDEEEGKGQEGKSGH